MRLLICDDHAIFREGLKAILRQLDAEVVEAGGADVALAALAADDSIDVVMLDLAMPGADGWTALRKLRAEYPQIPVVIVSASEEVHDARQALDDGAAGFIPKSSSPAVFRSALQLVLEGSLYIPPLLLQQGVGVVPPSRPTARAASGSSGDTPPLTARQREILVMMSRGLTNAEIGGALGIAEGTVKAHLSAIFQALDVTNRTEAALIMRELGLDQD